LLYITHLLLVRFDLDLVAWFIDMQKNSFLFQDHCITITEALYNNH